MSKVDLLVAPCSYEAAKFAVMNWHYSKSMPTPPLIKYGVWEQSVFIGSVIFGRGGNNNMLKPFGLQIDQGCELVRVALNHHESNVSQIVSRSIKALCKSNPDLRIIVSYADPNQNHHGGIYQAGNWIFSGDTSKDAKYIDSSGRHWHSRQVSRTGVSRQYGEFRKVPRYDECKKVALLGKHRYLYPLDKAMRRQIEPLAKPYPKRIDHASIVQNGNTPESHSGDDGSIPI